MLALSGAAWGFLGIIGATAITSAVALVVAWWARSTKVDSKIDGIDVAVQAVVDQLKAVNAGLRRAELRLEECEQRTREHLRVCHGGGDE